MANMKTLVIDNDLRIITIPPSITHLGVEMDKDVRRLHFSMPRMYDEVDLADFAVRINYMNAANEGDKYVPKDVEITEDTITFSWLVGNYALKYKGKVRFIVCLKELDEAAVVKREFNTAVAALPVLRGLETSEAIVQENPEILEAILLRMDALEQSAAAADCHIKYLESPDADGNPIYLRDLESGTYILRGRFIGYSIPDGATRVVSFSYGFPVVIGRTEEKTYLQCLYPPQNTVQYAEITDTDFIRGDRKLLYVPDGDAYAEIGQSLIVDTVDENGRPTGWKFANPAEIPDEAVAQAVQSYLEENPVGGVDFETDETLTLENGTLSVNTAKAVEQDNTLPITSAAVYTEVGNINALLATI